MAFCKRCAARASQSAALPHLAPRQHAPAQSPQTGVGARAFGHQAKSALPALPQPSACPLSAPRRAQPQAARPTFGKAQSILRRRVQPDIPILAAQDHRHMIVDICHLIAAWHHHHCIAFAPNIGGPPKPRDRKGLFPRHVAALICRRFRRWHGVKGSTQGAAARHASLQVMLGAFCLWESTPQNPIDFN